MELFKGKLTSDLTKHSGEGIFFTSRMFDFKNVKNIGHSFAEELFRVSKVHYPELKIKYCNAASMVEIFIKKALNTK